MPVRKLPAGELLYERRNGHFVLQVTGHPNFGVPFGQDRIVPIFLATLAVRQKSQTIRFRSAAQMLETFGMHKGGTPLIDRNVLRDLHIVLAKSGLPKMRMHDLRHSCASLSLAQGVSDRVVQDILGHSDIRLTKAVYQHVYDESRREAADTMDRLLGPLATKLATKTPKPA